MTVNRTHGRWEKVEDHFSVEAWSSGQNHHGMVGMKQPRSKLSAEEIDEIVVAEADDLSRWEEPIVVRPTRVISIRLSPEIIAKAKYFAQVYKARGYQTWLKQIIEERIRAEEKLLETLKRAWKASRGKRS